jgi:hypothetical protein
VAESLRRKGCCTKWVFENGGPESVPPGNGSSSVEQLYRPTQELHRPARDSKNDYIIIASNEIGVKYKETDHMPELVMQHQKVVRQFLANDIRTGDQPTLGAMIRDEDCAIVYTAW